MGGIEPPTPRELTHDSNISGRRSPETSVSHHLMLTPKINVCSPTELHPHKFNEFE